MLLRVGYGAPDRLYAPSIPTATRSDSSMTTDPCAHDAGLCRACGCCSDGTFFARGRLEPAEVDLARRPGLRLAADAESAMSPG